MRTKAKITIHSFVRHYSCMASYYSVYTTAMPRARQEHPWTHLSLCDCGVTSTNCQNSPRNEQDKEREPKPYKNTARARVMQYCNV